MCTFCGKSAKTVRVVVAQTASICEECLELCLEILEADQTPG